MKRPRGELLARAGLSADEDGRARRREEAERLEDLAEGGRVPDELDGVLVLVHGDELDDRARPRRDLERAVDQALELVEVDRLGDVVERSVAHGAHGRGHLGVGRDHDDRRLVPLLAQLHENVEPVAVGQPQVEEDHVERPRAIHGGIERVRRGAHGGDPVPALREPYAQGLADGGLVVDDEDVRHGPFERSSKSKERSPRPVTPWNILALVRARIEGHLRRCIARSLQRSSLRYGASWGVSLQERGTSAL